MVSSIQCGRIPVAFRMVHRYRAVIRDQYRRNTAEKFKHLDIRLNPVVCRSNLGVSLQRYTSCK